MRFLHSHGKSVFVRSFIDCQRLDCYTKGEEVNRFMKARNPRKGRNFTGAFSWGGLLLIMSIPPLANVVCNYTCYDRQHERSKQIGHERHPLSVAGMGRATPIL